ncbi:hypothetical protein TNCT_399051 [Trichonephila clavata]|uniref:Uncharacterized protein n=1 Tax=Trichonephila clavata TaxID=2740835 RepID=A0A8X6HM44_TRICU|nr:hypothetical protein TNCT_399051 [Trichonephila clavata]
MSNRSESSTTSSDPSMPNGSESLIFPSSTNPPARHVKGFDKRTSHPFTFSLSRVWRFLPLLWRKMLNLVSFVAHSNELYSKALHATLEIVVADVRTKSSVVVTVDLSGIPFTLKDFQANA